MPQVIGSVKQLVDILDIRVEKDQDAVLIVDSIKNKGRGKSTLSMLIAKEICRRRGFEFDIKKIVILDATTDKIVKLIEDTPPGYPLIIDEALRVAFNRNWNEKDQKELIRIMSACRRYSKIIIINNPSFDKLDSALREIADFRVSVISWGIAVVRKKVMRETGDPWLMKQTDKSLEEEEKEGDDDQAEIRKAITVFTKTPGFRGILHFSKLPDSEYAFYKQLSKELELKSLKESGADRQVRIKEAAFAIIDYLKGDMTWQDIAINMNRYLRVMNVKTPLSSSSLRDLASRMNDIGFKLDFDKIPKSTKKVVTEIEKIKKPIEDTNEQEAAGEDAE